MLPPLCVEAVWSRSVAFEAREKRSDPTTRVSMLNLFIFFHRYWEENEI